MLVDGALVHDVEVLACAVPPVECLQTVKKHFTTRSCRHAFGNGIPCVIIAI